LIESRRSKPTSPLSGASIWGDRVAI